MFAQFITVFRRAPGLAVCAAFGALSIAGCSLFHPVPKEPPVVAKTLPPPPALPKPRATHLFDVIPGSDIVGYV